MKTFLASSLLLACCLHGISSVAVDGEVYPKSSDNYGIKKTLKPHQMRTEGVATGYMCSICNQTVSATRELILDHEAEISEVLDQVCYKLFNTHPSQEAACEWIIKQELSYIVSLVKKNIKPMQICTNVGLC
ncbi:hypothetical protein Tcan_11441 [Toxocara canis]|uniref:Saposin B-type domain-containing protein n=1 Tax=Toxocara canis TaxID=6265 RepID=A0A0B2VTJ0_TOXCA|nr:hypothetical protein Tcan_11441 [Toxocara canis]